MRSTIELSRERLIVLYGLSAFIMNSVLRNSLMVYFGYSVMDINYICILILLIGGSISLCSGYIEKKKLYLIFMIAVYSISIFTSNILSSNIMGVNVLIFSFLPGLLVQLFDSNNFDARKVLGTFRVVYNSVMLIVLTFGIIDYFIGGKINTILATRFSSYEWARMIKSENLTFGFRMCTILGSPLMNAFFALVFISINNIYGLYIRRNKLWILFSNVFGIVVIILTGSRTAFILAIALVLISILVSTKNIRKIIVIVFGFIAIIVLVNSPIFQETIGVRFTNDLLSDGRFSLLGQVLNGDYGRVHFFYSEGYNYSRQLTSTGAAVTQNFEIPILMFLFDYGILATFIYYLIFIFIPIYRMIKSKTYYLLYCYIILFIHLNSFNCLAQKYDFNMMLGFLLLVFINLKSLPARYVNEQ